MDIVTKAETRIRVAVNTRLSQDGQCLGVACHGTRCIEVRNCDEAYVLRKSRPKGLGWGAQWAEECARSAVGRELLGCAVSIDTDDVPNDRDFFKVRL